jgi:hypothetical protein
VRLRGHFGDHLGDHRVDQQLKGVRLDPVGASAIQRHARGRLIFYCRLQKKQITQNYKNTTALINNKLKIPNQTTNNTNKNTNKTHEKN